MNATHPLHRLEGAETALVASLHAAADRLDAVGTTRLDDAMARFQASALAAQERLAKAGMTVQVDAADLLSSILAFAEELTPPAVESPSLPGPAAELRPVALADDDHRRTVDQDTPLELEDIERMADPAPVNRLDNIPFAAATVPFPVNGKPKSRKKR